MPTDSDITAEREAALLAAYAMHSADSAGRHYPELPHLYRSPYQRDRDRIVHSAAFRRLSHKTQVFTGEMGDYHRTRLTHTLEVSSIARTMARALRLNEDLVEALALVHDIGHPPFGHSGEDVLNECLRDEGGFDHNSQAIRILTVIETRYPDFPGLNLTHEVLEGQTHRADKKFKSFQNVAGGKVAAGNNAPPSAIRAQESRHAESPLLEVQVVDVADSIAYDAHDADDALEIGLLRIEELMEVPLWREAKQRVAGRRDRLNDCQLRRAIVHELIDWQVGDALLVVHCAVTDRGIRSVADVRHSPRIAHPAPDLAVKKQALEAFLFDHVYRHPDVLSKRSEAQHAIREMFATLVARPERLPAKFRQIAVADGLPRAVGDYLAGMTDHFAVEEHRRLVAE
ncbi:MAG: deoxyguanosinetriphosphate triphosphohydrolase [Planctomycetes bacterium]|nr:deoxyguanosinetriphosphate triphosphohydrolase [Planctomycetota bacterium]